ncbi:MAG: GNAT family N-acetyltransferase [Acidobacteria bacterium]|nr:MAG: GNAT family N-acetyltransferase [Acidobacteriota bacterium]REK02475.1 MAG: GNAT family N-acetyltransferase [Acidobacteriota bacterium]REK13723.1 MAG: GNAT family N-acetyltransferase [Acidobacteriota bacterium]REK41717.1 MAG: GNAT family N-acetyltransferase [Acidobacteriota bacterium]
MDKDFLTDLGFLGFVTRLKRISDTMLHDGRSLYKELGMDIEPNWYVIFRLLESKGEMTVTEIADEIGFAHPSVISIINRMQKAGYVESRQCGDDSRRRLLSLTEKAKFGMPEFERVWKAGVAGTKNLLRDVQALEFLELLENRIKERGFKERTLEALEKDRAVNVKRFSDELASDFARLNYQWIEEFYEVEEHDREQLDNPKDYIIDKGGEILFALIEGKAVGTVALIETGNGSYELAKMAVDGSYRGFGIGEKLMDGCIDFSRSAGKERIWLESNTRQIPAIQLYRKAGFVEIPMDPGTPYKRANIRMELLL